MECQQVKKLLWERLDGELQNDVEQAFDSHISSCPECAEELEIIKEISFSIKNPTGIEVEESCSRILSNVYDRYDRIEASKKKRDTPLRFLSFNSLLGSLAATAIFVLAIIGLWPQKTSAVGLDEIMTRHIVCIREGHFANYKCNTETEFAETVLGELGFVPTPFKEKKDFFFKGDVCKINKVTVAHALFDFEGVKISYFHVKESNVDLFKKRVIEKAGDGIWRYSREDHEMIILQDKKGLYSIYTAKLPFKKLKKFALNEHHPPS